MKKTRKKYTQEFKAEAVALVLDKGYSIADAANSLGISPGLLSKWKDNIQKSESGEKLTEAEKQELNRLRRENKKLRMEKEILKKASAFFAKEMK